MKNIESSGKPFGLPLGTIYLTGESVENGEVDLDKTIEHLKGIKTALKFYIEKQDQDLAGKNYSVEVRIKPGSLVTDVIGILVAGGAGTVLTVGASSYAKTAMEQLAKNDIGKKSSADIVKSALGSLKSTVRIAEHFGKMMDAKSFKPDDTKIIDQNHIELFNRKQESIVVTKAELDAYRETPKTKLREMVAMVDRNTSMYIDDKPIIPGEISEDAALITFQNKRVFDDRDEEHNDRLIFPELTQDLHVTLEGELTRGNGRTNTLGFTHDGRVLKAIPPEGGVKGIRHSLFGPVRIEAYVDRRSTAKGSRAVLKKPILRIVNIENIDEDADQQPLI